MLNILRRPFACQLEINFKFYSSFGAAMADAIEEKLKKPETGDRKRKGEQYKSRYNIKRKGWVSYNPDEKRENVNSTEERIKKKKCCMLLGYSGVNYFGMQRNPEMKTIEEDLLVAMYKNKWINDEAFKQAQTIQFQRAARTDKGVSAARQCVSLKLPEEVDIDILNKDLPDQIRVFCIKRVTKGFNSKDKCDARTYTYTLPTIAFADHNDQQVEMDQYRVPSEKIKRVNEILKMFIGTKNFHNFTSKKDYLDPSSKRYIISFECGEPFLSNLNVEFSVIKIKGQSFMLHQIRKMIGLTLAVVRNLTPIETVNRAFTDALLDLPMAPGLGLVLDQVHYDRYNNRYGTDGIHEPLTWEKEESEVQRFINEFINPTIIDTEIKEKSMITWMETLPLHSFSDRISSETKNDTESTNNADNDDDDDDDNEE